MIEVTEPDNAPKNENDTEKEDEKQQEEEKKEEKELYDIHFVYRTIEKRLRQHAENYVASSFGFKDKIGQGFNSYIHAFYDPSLDSGTVTIRNGKTNDAIVQKSLAELEASPIVYKFSFRGACLDGLLQFDTKT